MKKSRHIRYHLYQDSIHIHINALTSILPSLSEISTALFPCDRCLLSARIRVHEQAMMSQINFEFFVS